MLHESQADRKRSERPPPSAAGAIACSDSSPSAGPELPHDESRIGRRKRNLGELALSHPAYLGMLDTLWISNDGCWDEMNDEGRVGIQGAKQRLSYLRDCHPQLLLQLAIQGLKKALSRANLPARELPKPSVSLSRGSESD